MPTVIAPTSEPRVLKYWSLIEHLRGQIEGGSLRPGDRVPSLAEMRSEFGVSRATVEKAFDLLEQDGLVTREQGRGTFVSVPGTPAPKTSLTGLIGLLILTRNPYTPYMLQLLRGMREEAGKMGLDVLWLDRHENIPWEKLDGVLMYQGNEQPENLQVPPGKAVVSVVRHLDGYSNVTADDFGGMEQATEHLLSLGHRRIACLLSSPEDVFSRRRLAGYQAALERAGIPFQPAMVRYIHDYLRHNYLVNGEVCLRDWLAQDWKELGPTAIIAANDIAAIGMVKALTEAGLRVPEDVSVVGFDGTEASEYCTPRLTTIEVPLQDIGARAMNMLWHQIEHGPGETRDKILATRLKTGNSSAAPRG